jgi:hypothetical protein
MSDGDWDEAADQFYDASQIAVKQLESGYWLIRGVGPCEWAQPPAWPCSEETLRKHAFPEASEAFIRAALAAKTA